MEFVNYILDHLSDHQFRTADPPAHAGCGAPALNAQDRNSPRLARHRAKPARKACPSWASTSPAISISRIPELLHAIKLTDNKIPIDLILHTPGGLVLASEQIANALSKHKGKVTVFVPHYAMSGGTMVPCPRMR